VTEIDGLRGTRLGASFEDLSVKARIREVALRLFARDGSRAVSLRRIAAMAGVSLGAVVHHFGSKRALEQAVHQEVLARIRGAIHGVGSFEPTRTALMHRTAAFDALVEEQPYIADYIRQMLSGTAEENLDYFRDVLAMTRGELDAMASVGLARPLADPDVDVIIYFAVVNARFLLRHHIEAVLGADLSDPAVSDRVRRAEISLLTDPVFPIASDAASPPERRATGRRGRAARAAG
jgi:AcrR family transcriptional regulator